ncbi:MAG: hypothetical protein HZC28_16955 [Spirochaetes bacterium]|nr:hypothetical protein [Spirochaetota bacterium]
MKTTTLILLCALLLLNACGNISLGGTTANPFDAVSSWTNFKPMVPSASIKVTAGASYAVTNAGIGGVTGWNATNVTPLSIFYDQTNYLYLLFKTNDIPMIARFSLFSGTFQEIVPLYCGTTTSMYVPANIDAFGSGGLYLKSICYYNPKNGVCETASLQSMTTYYLYNISNLSYYEWYANSTFALAYNPRSIGAFLSGTAVFPVAAYKNATAISILKSLNGPGLTNYILPAGHFAHAVSCAGSFAYALDNVSHALYRFYITNARTSYSYSDSVPGIYEAGGGSISAVIPDASAFAGFCVTAGPSGKYLWMLTTDNPPSLVKYTITETAQ